MNAAALAESDQKHAARADARAALFSADESHVIVGNGELSPRWQYAPCAWFTDNDVEHIEEDDEYDDDQFGVSDRRMGVDGFFLASTFGALAGVLLFLTSIAA